MMLLLLWSGGRGGKGRKALGVRVVGILMMAVELVILFCVGRKTWVGMMIVGLGMMFMVSHG